MLRMGGGMPHVKERVPGYAPVYGHDDTMELWRNCGNVELADHELFQWIDYHLLP